MLSGVFNPLALKILLHSEFMNVLQNVVNPLIRNVTSKNYFLNPKRIFLSNVQNI